MAEQMMSPEEELLTDNTPPTLIKEMDPYLSEWIDQTCKTMNFSPSLEQKTMIKSLVDDQIDLLKKQGHNAVTAKGMAVLMMGSIIKIESLSKVHA